ncbi:sugar transferase [Emticicia oligotrophica DSM 17448]|uniref:Sugar transferase n=1 Tax=Emticicia oligotrophica (strain DSM 17448 / CIP 109782 / MTCC 6937 / GPTSA100-15) TaxID=929562 RepID=A0ABM5N1A9_EMTOG|nr:sugar transferase [Emticicia oligotrophica]AFK03208.1 sugar transferase [Emticicia oligotrophica DSM 17448]
MYFFLKNVVDFIIAFFLIIILSPLFFVIIALIFVNGEFPFYFQKRVGLNEKVFTIWKFKTMNDKRDESGELLSDEKRLTPVGRFIRKSSLDEIPQLFNVLKGEMSLIGPRPLLVEYLPLYDNFQKKRHNVKPGITGWAQVNGRNTLTWQQKFQLDVWYVENISLLLDVKILLYTIIKVVKSEGISSDGSVTMEKFKGNL